MSASWRRCTLVRAYPKIPCLCWGSHRPRRTACSRRAWASRLRTTPVAWWIHALVARSTGESGKARAYVAMRATEGESRVASTGGGSVGEMIWSQIGHDPDRQVMHHRGALGAVKAGVERKCREGCMRILFFFFKQKTAYEI